MITLEGKKKQIAIIATVIILLIILIGILFGTDSNTNKETVNKSKTTSTSTTLPPANSQACEFFKKGILAAALIVPDVNAVPSKDLKRCTYSGLNGGINYLTLFLGKSAQCDILKDDAKDPRNIPKISPGAFYFEVIDPTIIVKMPDRCFFVQGSKTLVNETKLTDMAIAIYGLFKSVDSTTITTTIPLDPNATTSTVLLPGQNTIVVPSSETTTTTK